MSSNENENHEVWTEKYRPKDFNEILGQEDIVKRVQAFVKKKNLPNLLFSGPPGVGKTTLALVIARKLYGENWRENLLELNASDERGIDIIRVKVKDFARTKALSDVLFKLVYLDESDALTKEAQQALRRVMEDFTRTCRFILSCNYSSKIIEPIQSRTVFFRFKPLKKEKIFTLIDKISKSEGLTVTKDGKEALYDASEGDCRKLENIMQACSALSKTIDEETVNKITSNVSKTDIKKIFSLLQRKDILNARKELIRTLLENGLSGQDMIKEIYKFIITMDLDDLKKLKCIEACGEIEFRLTEGSDTIIQLEALLARIARIILEE